MAEIEKAEDTREKAKSMQKHKNNVKYCISKYIKKKIKLVWIDIDADRFKWMTIFSFALQSDVSDLLVARFRTRSIRTYWGFPKIGPPTGHCSLSNSNFPNILSSKRRILWISDATRGTHVYAMSLINLSSRSHPMNRASVHHEYVWVEDNFTRMCDEEEGWNL